MKPFSKPFTTLTDNLRGKGGKSVWIEHAITVTCGIGSMLFGYDQGVMGGFLTSTPFENTFPSISGPNDSTMQGFTVAVYEIGCAIGALTVIFGGDMFGRRVTVMLGELILIIGAILQASSFGLAQLIVGRIITGIGNGMAVAVLPTWNGETSRATSRGRSIMWQLNINILGIAIAYWVDYAVSQSSTTSVSDWSWRFPLALQVLFAAVTIVFSFFLPDSPRALVKQGRLNEARDVIDMLSPIQDVQERTEITNITMMLIQNNLEEEAECDSSWHDVFSQGKPRFAQRLTLAILSLAMLQISGINLITYCHPVIFEHTIGMSRDTALLVSGINGLEYWLATFIPIPLVDRVGRRPLMLFAAIGQCFCMAVLAGCIANPENKAAGYTAAVFLFLFNTFFAVGFCGIPFLLPVELTPLLTRGKSVAIATGIFWLCNFFVVMISPVLIDNIQYKTYILWMCTNLVFIALIYFFIPETGKAALEDIDVLFEENPTWLIGPGSKRKIAQIIANREAYEMADKATGDATVSKQKIMVEAIENAPASA